MIDPCLLNFNFTKLNDLSNNNKRGRNRGGKKGGGAEKKLPFQKKI